MTRRGFFGNSALMAAAQAGLPGQEKQPQRNLLASIWSAEKLAAVARGKFHPFPAAAERSGWEALPEDARVAVIAAGEKQLQAPWQVLPVTIALEFARNGNRSRYEALSFGRRRKLADLVVAECVEGKGRFLDEIVNGIWLVSEETFWGVPAHLGAQKARVGLPDVGEPIVDLFAAETAAELSWILYLLEPQLKQVSKLIPQRIRVETQRRILTPCLDREDFGWMGFNTPPPNNWNPWICSNWLTTLLIVEQDEKRRTAAVQKIVRCLDHFLNGYADDGGCDEGPSYWGRAGASLFDCLELLYQASNGAVTAYDQPLIRQIGLYIAKAHIAQDWYTNFSDAPAKVQAEGDLIYRYGKRVGDETMMGHGAFVASARLDRTANISSLGRELPAIFNLSELRKASPQQALLRDGWMPGIGVMTARVKAGSSQGLYVAAEAGHNGKSHNHNDTGNFIVFADGAPVLIDVGVETYTAKTFSSKRYEIWTMQSAFHNCPTINGVMQAPGRQFGARDVSYKQTNAGAELSMDIAKAYPKEANVESWKRSILLDRGRNQIEVKDEFNLSQAAKDVTLTLMTPCKVEVERGVLKLENRARVTFDPSLTATVEEIKVEDGRLRNVWGERLFRVLLKATGPVREGKWVMGIAQA